MLFFSRRVRGVMDSLKRTDVKRRFCMTEALEPRTVLSAGAFDATFSAAGIATTGSFVADHLAAQTDGKILAIGKDAGSGKTTLRRFLADGTLDTTFGTAGVVSSAAGHDLPDDSYNVVVGSAGRIFVVGTYSTINASVTVYRLTSTGAWDKSFANNLGVASFVPSYVYSDRYTILADATHTPDNKLLIGVTVGAITPTTEVMRLTENGTLDTSFSSDGRAVITGPGGADFEMGGMTIDSAGSYCFYGDLQMVRMTSAGAYDSTFSVDGKVSFDSPRTRITKVVPISRQVSMLFGWDRDGMLYQRYKKDGTLDTSLGVQHLQLPASFQATIRDALLIPDGSYLIVGDGYDLNSDGHRDIFLVRIAPDGMQDMSFGGNGWILTNSGGDDIAFDALLQTDGKVLVAQNSQPATTMTQSLSTETGYFARYNGKSMGTTDIVLSDTMITVTGSDLADNIKATVDGDVLTIQAGSIARRFMANSVNSITVNAGLGDDQIDLSHANLAGIIDGGDGNDVILCPIQGTYAIGGSGDDVIIGNVGNDSLTGAAGRDRIWGRAGSDRLNGGAHNDKLYGEEGNDRLYGGDANDFLSGGSNTDYLYGEAGDDYLQADSGGDLLAGLAGNDTLVGGRGVSNAYQGGDGIDTALGVERLLDTLDLIEQIL